MFREMTKCKQILSKKDMQKVMERGSHGVMACIGDNDYPYAVPLNYIYYNDKIYFHSAKTGYKLDSIIKNPKVSFAVVDEDKIVSEEYTSYFRSVIAYGKVRIVESQEWYEAFGAFVEKYSGNRPKEEKVKNVKECNLSYVLCIDIDHITGKEAEELVDKDKG
jgi:hypothetical protein